MKIEITQEDIDAGRIRDARGCAIAVALKETLAYDISVTGLITIGKDQFKAAPEVVRWFSAFDRDKNSVKPITIDLVAYEFGKIHHYGKKKQPVFICGEARVSDDKNDDAGGKAISKQA